MVGAQIDPCGGPGDVSGYLFSKAIGDNRNAVRDRHVYGAIATVSDDEVGNRDTSAGWPPLVTMIVTLPATKCDERGNDDPARVAIGNGVLCDEDKAFGAVDLLPPVGQLGLASRRAQRADVTHLRVGGWILAGVQVAVGLLGHGSGITAEMT